MNYNTIPVHIKELSYSVKCLLDISFINDDWIDENLNFEEINHLIMLTFNDPVQKILFNKGLMIGRKVKKYELKSCEIFEDDRQVFAIGCGKLLIELTLQADLITKTKFRRKGIFRITSHARFHSYIKVQVLVQSRVVDTIAVKEIRLTSRA